MPAGITNDDTVRTGFGISQWHKLGRVEEGALSREMIFADLGWRVEKRALYTDGPLVGIDDAGNPHYAVVEVPERSAVVRVDTGKVMAPAVSPRYQPFQNEAGLDMLADLVELGVPFVSAGSLWEGRVVYACLQLRDYLSVGDVTIAPYLVGRWGHDAMTGIGFFTAPLVPLCANTLQWADDAAASRWSTTHNGNATERLAEARKSLGLAEAYYGAYQAMIDRAVHTTLSLGQMHRAVKAVFAAPPDASDDQLAAVERNRTRVLTIYGTDERFLPWNGTVWGGLQAFNTYDQWGRPVQGKNKELGRALQQAARASSGQVEAFDTKALDALLAVAGAPA